MQKSDTGAVAPLPSVRSRRRTALILGTIALSFVLAAATLAYFKRVSPLGLRLWGQTYYGEQRLALDGYDPVAYHLDFSARKGEVAHALSWAGTEWRFVSERNKQFFAENPKRFLPKFGGYCAYAVSKGFTAASSPEAWLIMDGDLYLFADAGIRDDWASELSNGVHERANENWRRTSK